VGLVRCIPSTNMEIIKLLRMDKLYFVPLTQLLGDSTGEEAGGDHNGREVAM
jgi:hypothetical protein